MFNPKTSLEVKSMQPKIDKIIIVHKIDESPDWSYLETDFEELPNGKLKINSSCQIDQSFADKHPRLAKRYIKENNERLKQINDGSIWAIGIYAKAIVKVNRGNYSRLDELQSSGLWGIESDSGPDYIKEVETQELADLKEHLKAFNVDVSNFEELTKNAETKNL